MPDDDNPTIISQEEVQRDSSPRLRSTGIPIGSVFADQYDIVGRLGQGGMSTVYKAVDKNLKRTIALKTLLPHLLENEDHVKRFQREAQSIGTLKHRNIVEVYAYAISPDGYPYIAMEYLEGDTISSLVKREGRMKYERAVPILIQVAEALAHAHAKGVVHRDLKPSNVLVRDTDDKKDHVGILDFGLAKFMPSGSVTASSLTHSGEIFGSPPYMSPEQCQGEQIDQRADVYSFGCMMYELLSGRPPLVGDTPVATVMKQIATLPSPFSEVCPDANIPPGLQAICLKALAKDPAGRQQSMIELAEELRQFSSLQAVGMEYKPVNVVDRTKLVYARHRKAMMIGVALVVVLVAAFFFWWTHWVSDWHGDRKVKWLLSYVALAVVLGTTGYTLWFDRKMRRPKVDMISAASWIEADLSETGTEALRISRLADSNCATGNYKLAEENYGQAIKLWQTAGQEANRDLAFVKYAHMCTLRFKQVEVPMDFSAAVNNVEKSFGPGSQQSQAARNAYASYLWQQQQYVTAITQRPR
jgi:tRNA A-37 threonylcarbamoyl transferase component Bud32